jgi:SAM-dependent methyltransferase
MMSVAWIARRTLAVLRREGPLGTLQRVVRHARIAIGLPSHEAREEMLAKDEADRAFDAALGVDTGGTTHLFALTIDSPNAPLGVSHIATGPGHFRNAMDMLDVDPHGYTFVDLGAGKGRALMMAAEYPFAAIVGVEFAQELHAICQRNIARFGDARIACRLGDAEQFAYPDGDLVVFMNNPFDRPLVARVAERLVALTRERSRTVRLVYVNPRAPDLFGAAPWYPVGSRIGVAVFGLGG